MTSCLQRTAKRAAKKAARQEFKRDLPVKLVDDYTLEEFWADICTEEEPCPACRAAAARRAFGFIETTP